MRARIETAVASQPATTGDPGNGNVPATQLPMRTPMPNGERQTVQVRSDPVPAVKLYPPKIAKALLDITRKISPIQKAGINDFHKYAYPKWEDIRDELWPLMSAAGLIVIQNEISHEGLTTDMIAITYSFTILNDDGDVWPVTIERTAVCKIRDGKGVLDDKAASKCGTQAEKNAMVQLFKIRTEDVYEVDNQGKVHAGARRVRPAPSPDGKIGPHYVQPLEGDSAEVWSAKFIAFISKATSIAELDQWDEHNGKLLDRIKNNPDTAAVFNRIVDAMNAREATFKPAKPAAQAAQVQNGGFPGDKSAPKKAEEAGIPINLDRQLSEGERDWLMSLVDAYRQCTTTEEIGAEQDSIMLPAEGTVSDHAWLRAVELTEQHNTRVGGPK